MKTLVICVLFLVVAAVSAAPANPAELVEYINKPYDNELGKYSFEFQQTDGTRHYQRGIVMNQGKENEFLGVSGEYSWIAPNRVRYTVKYVADKKGYNPKLEEQVLEEKEEPPGGALGTTKPPPAPAPLEIANSLLGR